MNQGKTFNSQKVNVIIITICCSYFHAIKVTLFKYLAGTELILNSLSKESTMNRQGLAFVLEILTRPSSS